MIVKRLDTGYYYVRWNGEQFVLWPIDRAPTMEDAFGWVSSNMLEEAVRLVAEMENKETP